ncbi:MAG: NADH:flavin oxidoreductase, partial [Planctomycetes bacterium]|nr:NADH:flavin oxidoreductase [Planctomycetota bacterium]
EKVHAHGGRIAAQIVHCGNAGKPENNGGSEVIGPSDRFDDDGKRMARAMTRDEIKRTVKAFGASAVRALDSGFDAIQLHYAHGYLGSQFLSPRHNRRDDEYGGTPENRRRFLKEVYETVRGVAGDDHPVMAKLNLEDFLDDGLTREEGLAAAAMLHDLGLDALEVSGGTAESGKLGPARRIEKEEEEAYFKDNAAAVKRAAKDMPVMLVGGLRTPLKLMQIHGETGIDYFSMSRPFIREPHLIKRWQSGKTHPAECVSCSGCFLSIKYGIGVHCLKLRKKEK